MNYLFDFFNQAENYNSINFWIERNDNDIIINLNTAGFKKEELSIMIEDSTLIIKGSKNKNINFEKTFSLSNKIDLDNISSEYNDGLLKITLKNKTHVGRKIDIN